MNYKSMSVTELEHSQNQITFDLNSLTNEQFLEFVKQQQELRGISVTTGKQLLHTINSRGVHTFYDQSIIHNTSDLEMFGFKKTNRVIKQKQVDRIYKTIKENGIRVPIVVDKYFKIGDGQHRLKALEKYNRENPNDIRTIPFIIREIVSDKSTRLLNATSEVWNPLDFLHSFVESGYPDYIKLQNFVKKNEEFTFNFCTALCQDDLSGIDRHGGKSNENHNTENSTKDKFEQGLWTIASDDPNLERAQQYADDIKKVFKFYNKKSQNLCFALFNLLKNVSKFDLNRFIDKLQENYLYYNKIKIHNRQEAYDFINEVYNKNVKKNQTLNILVYYNNKKNK